MNIMFFASPWWVNGGFLVPIAAFLYWRGRGLDFRPGQLAALTAFGVAFGFVEAAVVVYLRAATGLLPGFQSGFAEVVRQSSALYRQTALLQFLAAPPKVLVTVELFREAATMAMLVAIAWLAGRRWRERSAAFLYAFAFWDIFYYVFLWLLVRWPQSLKTVDVLFLIPVPWVSQVWYPILVSGLSIAAVIAGSSAGRGTS